MRKINELNNKLNKDFVMTVDFSIEDKDVFISKDNKTCERYDCENINDLINAVKKFYQSYMLEENKNKIISKEVVR